MTDIDKLIDELVRGLSGRPILEIATAARQIESRVRDLYLDEALRKYAADHREEPSRHVVAALHRLLAPLGSVRPLPKSLSAPSSAINGARRATAARHARANQRQQITKQPSRKPNRAVQTAAWPVRRLPLPAFASDWGPFV